MAQRVPLPPSQRLSWTRILTTVREQFVEPALKEMGVEDVEWTEFRWNSIDVTAAWPKNNPQRNVHGWLIGTWPTYGLNFEGAAWEDDWDKLKRRVVFFRGPRGVVELDPPWEDPRVRIVDSDRLKSQLAELVRQIKEAVLEKEEWRYDLQPAPRLQ